MAPFDLQKIGQLLKDSREEKGLSVADVSKALFINKRIIGAIEAGNWDDLPPQVYVKAFITQYAALLHIVDLVEAELASTVNQAPSERPHAQAPSERPHAQAPSEKQHVVTVRGREEAPKGWGSAKKIITATAIGAIAVAFLILRNVPRTTPVAPSVEPSPVTPSTRSVEPAPASPPVQTTPVAPSVEPTPAVVEEKEKPLPEEKKLTILCHERTWVRIVIDGAERKEFMLNPEDVVMLGARERFELLVGNAGGVTLLFNGKDTGFTGNSGEVKSVSLP